MRITILGTGNLAVALGRAWHDTGHDVRLTGRNPEHARVAAERVGVRAAAPEPAAAADGADVLVVAVPWDALTDALALVGARDGSLAGRTVLDATNAVDFATGTLLIETGSAAELVARTAPGAHVVKALHLFAGASWPYTGDAGSAPVVVTCGDEPGALDRVATLVADLGGHAVVAGGLDHARALEQVAGVVMRVVAAGANPRRAVPDVEPTPA